MENNLRLFHASVDKHIQPKLNQFYFFTYEHRAVQYCIIHNLEMFTRILKVGSWKTSSNQLKGTSKYRLPLRTVQCRCIKNVEAKNDPLCMLVLNGDEWSASRWDLFILRERASGNQWVRRMCEAQSWPRYETKVCHGTSAYCALLPKCITEHMTECRTCSPLKCVISKNSKRISLAYYQRLR
jgi:hypothetical protein